MPRSLGAISCYFDDLPIPAASYRGHRGKSLTTCVFLRRNTFAPPGWCSEVYTRLQPQGDRLVREPEPATRVVRFGVFEVDLQTAELRKQGVRIRLPGQSFQVLEALLLRPGELVTREELERKLLALRLLRRLRARPQRRREPGARGAGRLVRQSPLRRDAPPAGLPVHRPGRANGFGRKEDPSRGDCYPSTERADPYQRGHHEPTSARPTTALDSSGSLRAVAAGCGRDFSLHSPEKSAFVALPRRGPGEPPRHPADNAARSGNISVVFSPTEARSLFAWDGGNSSATNPFQSLRRSDRFGESGPTDT